MCVSACTQKAPNLRFCFLKRRLTNTPRRHRLADGQLSSLYAPLPSFSSFGAASVMMCCSARPASSSAPSVLPEDRIGRNIIYIRRFCDHINVLHIFDQTCIVLKSGWSSTMGLPHRWSSSLSPSHPSTPPPSRWSAVTTLPPLAKFQLVWLRLCEALRSSSSLAGQKHPSLLSRLV